MTVWGYVRVQPHSEAGTAERWRYALVLGGCDRVSVDVWRGREVPPAFDELLGRVREGDEVRVPDLAHLGPTHVSVKFAMTCLHRRGVRVVVTGERVPA